MVALDLHAPVKRAGDRLLRRAVVTASRIDVGRESRPSRRAEQGVESTPDIGPPAWAGSGSAFGSSRWRRDSRSPEESFGGGGVIVRVLEMDQVQAAIDVVEGLDRRNHAAPVADRSKHTGTRNRRSGGRGGAK